MKSLPCFSSTPASTSASPLRPCRPTAEWITTDIAVPTAGTGGGHCCHVHVLSVIYW